MVFFILLLLLFLLLVLMCWFYEKIDVICRLSYAKYDLRYTWEIRFRQYYNIITELMKCTPIHYHVINLNQFNNVLLSHRKCIAKFICNSENHVWPFTTTVSYAQIYLLFNTFSIFVFVFHWPKYEDSTLFICWVLVFNIFLWYIHWNW